MRLARGALACLGTVLILVGLVAGVANREVLDADRFASHVDAVRSDPDVSRQVGGLLTDRLLEDQPDLVAVRPLIESTAATVVASPALGPVVRAGVAPLYDALVLGDDGAVVLRLADVGAIVVGALAFAAPQASVPPDLDVRLSQLGGQEYSAGTIGAVHWVELLAWLCPLLGVLLLGAAGALTSGARSARAREAVRRVGVGVATAGLVLSGLLVVAGFWVERLSRDTVRGAVRHAVWRELDGPLWAAAGIAVALGALLAVAAGVTDWPRLRDVRGLVDLDRSPRRLAARAAVLGAVGVALVLQPARVATVVLALLGVGLVAVALVSLTVAIGRSPRRRTGVLVVAVALVAAISVSAWPGDHELATATSIAPRAGCNGHVELCSRRYDEVAYPATHNSMAAASEPGWFFPEQPDGIIAQLDHGVRVLLIDSWPGQRTDRPGVIAGTDSHRAAALAQAEVDLGAATVRSALRVRDAAGLTPQGPVEPYLCHALCELGSTHWLDSLRDVHAWMAAHPDEVVTFFVQDEVSPEDTADLIEQAGLLPYVYTPVGDAWPTLGQMIASGKRLVVLMENHDGGTTYPWLMAGFEQAQDTPFLFRRPAQLTAAGSCVANRGVPDAGLFLLNHWVTDKTAEVTNAARVNAADVLLTRARECQRERGMLPNYVAVDFYDRGDLFDVVDELNGL